jgi:tetratricopeptide (TPR) repeat protein
VFHASRILRARRFLEDARDYYKYALARGGNSASLTNKLGLTELEMRNVQLARAYFQRAVKMSKRDPEAWNNLGGLCGRERGERGLGLQEGGEAGPASGGLPREPGDRLF